MGYLAGREKFLIVVGLVYFLIYGLNLGTEFFTFDDAFNLSKPIIYDYIYLKLYWIWHHSLVPLIHTFWILLDWLGISSAQDLKTISIILHGLNSLLVFVFLRRLNKVLEIGSVAVLYAPILFLLHPMCVESVSWISEQKTLFSFMLTLLSLIFLLQKKFLAAIICFGASVLFKPASIMIPAIIFIFSEYFSENKKKSIKFLTMKMIVLIVLGIYLSELIEFYEGEGLVKAEYSVIYRLFSSGIIFLTYFEKLLLPLNLHFGYDLSFVSIKSYAFLEGYRLAGSLLIFCGMICVAYAKRDKKLIFFLITFFVLTIPYLAFITYGYHTISLLADHYMYFALVPFLICIICTFEHFKLTNVAISLLLILYCFQTYTYSKDWRSNKDVIARALKYSPRNLALNIASANLLLNQKHHPDELEELTKNVVTNNLYSDELFFLLKKLYMGKNDFSRVLELEGIEKVLKK